MLFALQPRDGGDCRLVGEAYFCKIMHGDGGTEGRVEEYFVGSTAPSSEFGATAANTNLIFVMVTHRPRKHGDQSKVQVLPA